MRRGRMSGSVLKALDRRQLGQDADAGRLVDLCCRQMQLSQSQDVQPVFDSAVNTLALDAIEHRYLLSGTNGGGVYIHDLYNFGGSPRFEAPLVARLDRGARLAHEASVTEVSWLPADTGLFLSSGTGGRLHVWDANALSRAETFKFRHALIGHHMSPAATAHCLIAVCGQDPDVTLCDLRSGSRTHVLRGHSGQSVDTCRWSPTEQHVLATGGRDKRILFWDVRAARSQLACLGRSRPGDSESHRCPLAALRFTPDGTGLVSVTWRGTGALWSLLTGRRRTELAPRLRLPPAGGLGYQFCVWRSPGGRRLACLPSAQTLRLCDLDSGQVCHQLDGHLSRPLACQHEPLTNQLISGGADNNVLIWSHHQYRDEDGSPDGSLYQDQWSDQD